MFCNGDEKLREKADRQSEESLASPQLAELSDPDLVQRWRGGSHDAAAILAERYSLRLVALVASRVGDRMRSRIDADGVVQSAMGSFFGAARGPLSEQQWQFSDSLSLWNLLATFARRKLARAIERETATKRGVGWQRIADEQLDSLIGRQSAASDDPLSIIRDLDESLLEKLTEEQLRLLADLVSGCTQAELASSRQVNVRTVRRRINELRKLLAKALDTLSSPQSSKTDQHVLAVDISLPKITYAQFVLGKMIGAGSVGKVYRARMQADGKLVAVKFMRKRFWSNPVAGASFMREVERATRIRHPNVLHYLAWGESPQGGLFLVSEFIDGKSLSNCRPDSPTQCTTLLMQICNALAAAHLAGVTHGDITPNNVMVSKSGQVVLTDFGFAKLILDHDALDALQASPPPLGGTLGFAAPEQISTAFGDVGPATDIYAVGGLAHWLLTGRPPHGKGDVPAAIEDTISDENAKTGPLHDGSIAANRLAKVASLALQKSIADRPGHVQILAGILSGDVGRNEET